MMNVSSYTVYMCLEIYFSVFNSALGAGRGAEFFVDATCSAPNKLIPFPAHEQQALTHGDIFKNIYIYIHQRAHTHNKVSRNSKSRRASA